MKKEVIVRKAVIPVAGLGTRMLPATKAIPKEMLPVVDKPLIQYVVKEAIAAGIKEIILVTHSSKNSIENHFDKSFELEATLEKRVKRQLLAEVQNICPKDVTIMHIRQGEAKGLGHAILCAHPLVGDNPFAVLLPDVLIDEVASDPLKDNLAEMVKMFVETSVSQIMVEPAPVGAEPWTVNLKPKVPLSERLSPMTLTEVTLALGVVSAPPPPPQAASRPTVAIAAAKSLSLLAKMMFS